VSWWISRRLSWAVLASLAVLGTTAFMWFEHDLSAARARLTGRSELTATRIGTVEFAQFGSGAAVLVSHGAEGGFDQGLEMTIPFAARGYRLIVPSRAGYLRSTMPGTFTVAEQADAYADLLDHLQVEQAAIVGISAGAWSALAFATRYPDRCRALILIAPANSLPHGVSNHGGRVTAAMFRSDFAAWLGIKLAHLMPGSLSRIMLGTEGEVVAHAGESERERLRLLLEHLLPMEERWPGMRFDIATAAHPEEPQLTTIRCPVLAISARDDAFGTELQGYRIVKAVQDGRLIVYSTGGHALVGRQQQVFETVDAFLRAH
jgi:pimeloyl-ACP methyl ester carboxylesterase